MYLISNSSTVQTFIAKRATEILSSTLGTEVHIERAELRFFTKVVLHHVLIRDLEQDTLVYTKELYAKINFINPLDNRYHISELHIDQLKINFKKKAGEADYNYEFLSPKSEKPKSATGEIPDFKLGLLSISNLQFKDYNADKRQNISISSEYSSISSKKFDLRNKSIHIDALILEKADIDYQVFGLVDSAKNELHTSSLGTWNPDNWDIKIGHTMLSNSSFRYQRTGYMPEEKGIDYNDLLVENIHMDLANTWLDCDSIKSNIQNLRAKEKSGFEINQLQSAVKIAPNEMIFAQLNLITPNSNIKDYYAMHYSHVSDFNDYVNKVRMVGDFKKSDIAIKDINYFARVLDKIEHNKLQLSGEISGPVKRLRAKNLKLKFAANSYFEGDISLSGLPNFQECYIHLDIKKSKANFKAIYDFYPYMNPAVARLDRLGTVDFRGKFIGFPNDFVAEGNMLSEIGVIQSDINLKLEKEDEKSSYSGKLSASDFDLGKWLNQEDELGKLSFSSELKGTGLKLDNMNAYMLGEVTKLGVLGYDYNHIEIDGSLQRRLFEGKLISKDPNLDLDFDGLVNLESEIPILSFKANLRNADLKALNISTETYTVQTEVQLDLTGDDIDNFDGTGSLSKLKIRTEKDSFQLNSLTVVAKQSEEQSRYFGVQSDIVDASFNGYFSFRTLPKALRDFARYYIVQYSKSEDSESYIKQSEQLFTFDINVKDSKNFTELISPSFKKIRNANLSGSFSSFNNTLIVRSEIENIHIMEGELRNFKLKTTSGASKFHIESSIDSILQKDSLISESIVFHSDFKEDSVHFHLGIQNDNEANHLSLNGFFQSDLNSLRGSIKNSEIALLNQIWKFQEPNSIQLSEEHFLINNLKLSNNEHLLKINTEMDKDSLLNLNAELDQFPLSDISDILRNFTHLNWEGMASGNIIVKDLFNKRQLQSSLNIEDLKIDEVPMGDMNARLAYGHNSDLLNIEATLKSELNDVILSGNYDFENEDNALNLIFRIRKFDLSDSTPFLRNIVTRPRGNISGNVFLYGALKKPILDGKLTGTDVSAKVNYLNTRYTIPTLTADLQKDRINFGSFEVRDEQNNIAQGNGKIRHDYLKNFFLDFNILTDRFKFLDTRAAQNESFYGTAYGKGYVMIAGDLNNIDFYINATTLKESNLAVSVSETKDVEQYSFYRFVKSEAEKEKDKKKAFEIKRSPISVNMDLNVTEQANLKLILDYEEGDIIQGNGLGRLKISVDNFNELNIAGKYEITEGDYLFSLQNIISKKFKMEKGSSITWLGDPADAILDIKAVYKLRTSPYDLIEDAIVANTDLESAAKSRVPTYLYLLINGTLNSPRINFDIKIPDADQAIKSTLNSKLQLVKLDANELNKQVVALLVLNRFVPVYPLGSNNNTVLEGVNNTVSEFLSNQLSLHLSDWISQFITELQLNINFRNYQAELGENGSGIEDEEDFQNRRELQLALTKSFLDNRLTIDIGGNFDFGQENQNASKPQNANATNVTGDFEIQYGLTKDNRLRLKAFRKSEYDIFNERNRNKTGLGVLYKREFDNVKDLLRFRKRNREKKLPSEAQEQTPKAKEEE